MKRATGLAPGSPPDLRDIEGERLARAALSRLAEPGTARLGAAIAELGAIEVMQRLLAQDGDRAERGVAARLAAIDPAAELERAARVGLRFLIPGDDEWPTQLEDLREAPPLQGRGGPPIGLWVRGPMQLSALAGSVAIVGSRSSTTYGEQIARDLAADLARAGRPVVSGAAFGIDQAAHRGALGGRGQTVAVLACGADRAYPRDHAELISHLAETGAVISETPPAGAPMRVRFLGRNRLIAALSRGTIVVEAARRSGALNTANWADRLHRVVMGVPGPVTAEQSQGVHDLLRAGVGTVVTTGADVLELVGSSGSNLCETPRGRSRPRDRLDLVGLTVLDAVPVSRPAPTEAIATICGLDAGSAGEVLADLQEAGFVERVPGGWRVLPEVVE